MWTGIGALGTFLVGILWFGDSSNIWRMLAASFLLIGIIGLKLAPGIDVVFGSLTGVREKPFPSAFRIGGLSSVRWLFPTRFRRRRKACASPARGKRNGAHLGAVRHAAALELLAEETADEDAEAAADEVRLKFAAEGMFRQVQDFIRFRTVFDEVEEEKVVQVIRSKHVFRFLFNGASRSTAAGAPG